jgi:catechol 2,3-dioxygenase
MILGIAGPDLNPQPSPDSAKVSLQKECVAMLPDSTHIAFIHLQVASLPRSLAFYRDLLGFQDVTRSGPTALLSANGQRPYTIALTENPKATHKPPRTTGLYHVAIRLPDRSSLARILRRLVDYSWPLQGAADHDVSEALYLADPDGIGLELYTDRPRDLWRMENDQVAMTTNPLDMEDLLAQIQGGDWEGIDPRTDIGHVHLHVSNLELAERFYAQQLGLDVMQRGYPGALFLAAGGYHHHLGVNIWAGHNAPPPPPDSAGMIAYGWRLPDESSWQQVVDHLREAGTPLDDQYQIDGSAYSVLARDPDFNGVALVAD